MKKLCHFFSNSDKNLKVLFFGFVVSAIILMFSSAFCLYYGIVLDLPTLARVVFLFGFLFLGWQSCQSIKAIKSLLYIVQEICVYDTGFELSLIFGNKHYISAGERHVTNDIAKRDGLLDKIFPKDSQILNIQLGNGNFIISLNADAVEELKKHI